MSLLKVNTIQDKGGNNLLVSDGAGTISSGGLMTMTPAFEVKLTTNQTISDDTHTKIQFNSVLYDTNSGWDSSNYRWTPAVAGRYAVYGDITCDSDVNSNLDDAQIDPRLSNTSFRSPEFIFKSNPVRYAPLQSFQILNVSATDYIEIFTRINATDSSGGRVLSGSIFGAYKIIGA